MNCCKRHYLAIATVVSFIVLGIAVWHEHRRAQGYRELALTVSSVSSVTVYDVGVGNNFSLRRFDYDVSTNSLSSIPSATFPLEVFINGAGSAEYQPVRGIWKGAVLAVLTLRDGNQRRVRLSYIGGVFALEGVPGDYIAKGGWDSEFHRTFKSIIADQFIPKRDGQKKTPYGQGAGAE